MRYSLIASVCIFMFALLILVNRFQAEEITIQKENLDQLIKDKKINQFSEHQHKALKKLLLVDSKIMLSENGKIEQAYIFDAPDQLKEIPQLEADEIRFKEYADLYKKAEVKGVLESLMFFDDIKSISIHGNYLTNFNFIGLCKIKNLENLQILHGKRGRNVDFVEDGYPWTGETLIYLCCADSLKRLSIPGTAMTDKQSAQLARFQNLEYLDLRDTGVSSRAMEFVCLLKKLEYLDLRRTGVDADGIEKIKNLPLKKFCPPFRVGMKTFAEWKAIFPKLEEIIEDDKYQSLKK